ncbi:hypothetical protein J53TS2_29800 [Paenibacillus sp. J53TS2]|nr:hypothetical protein J53TS2_29800 [Paenibacillus sp. J53TS2]
MSYKSILIDQLNACYNDKSWFIPLHEILIDLDATQAAGENESEFRMYALWRSPSEFSYLYCGFFRLSHKDV